MSVGSMRCFEGFDHAHTSEQQLQACDLRSPGCRICVLCKQLCTRGATCGQSTAADNNAAPAGVRPSWLYSHLS
jgi:hypothetical protein